MSEVPMIIRTPQEEMNAIRMVSNTKEETYKLALESIERWLQRWYDADFNERTTLKAIETVVKVALEKSSNVN